ncbi:Uncharacterised protein [Enterococcus faecalis]|uniref:Uncharacterized protein n=1 Tax=Enterococcus faecalis TaxID=1351 RepID=A0AAX2KWM1_ENTFL|nr:Uncharacterised protein [Enterococcus faecalis]
MLRIDSWSDFNDGFVDREMLSGLDVAVLWVTKVAIGLTGLSGIISKLTNKFHYCKYQRGIKNVSG